MLPVGDCNFIFTVICSSVAAKQMFGLWYLAGIWLEELSIVCETLILPLCFSATWKSLFSLTPQKSLSCVAVVTFAGLCLHLSVLFPRLAMTVFTLTAIKKASSYSLSNSVLVLAVRMVLDGGLNNLFVLTSLLGTAWFTGLSCYCSCLILWRRQVVSSLVVRQKSFFSFCKLFFFIFHQPLESEKISSDFAFLLKFCCFWNCLCFS